MSMSRVVVPDERRIDALVSKHVRMFRVARKLSQTELGEKLSVTFQQIQKYEKGTNSMPSGRIRMLCDALGITPNDLFGVKTNGHEKLPTLSPQIYRIAFKMEALPPAMRLAIGSLVDDLMEHITQEPPRKVPIKR